MPPEASLDFGHPFPLPQIARVLRLCLRFPSTNTSVRAAEESSLSYTKNSGRTNGKELSLHVANTTLLQGFSPISKRMQTGSREECKLLHPSPEGNKKKTNHTKNIQPPREFDIENLFSDQVYAGFLFVFSWRWRTSNSILQLAQPRGNDLKT